MTDTLKEFREKTIILFLKNYIEERCNSIIKKNFTVKFKESCSVDLILDCTLNHTFRELNYLAQELIYEEIRLMNKEVLIYSAGVVTPLSIIARYIYDEFMKGDEDFLDEIIKDSIDSIYHNVLDMYINLGILNDDGDFINNENI